MELYTKTSYELAEKLTKRYSTSFSLSSQLLHTSIRHHIYAIYALVRIGDEIVDTYMGHDAEKLLKRLHQDTLIAIGSGYSVNPIIHAFAATAREFMIDDTLIAPFFESMHSDLTPTTLSKRAYERYIYGSAEVVGLMCLKVFTADPDLYDELAPGARALGSAYQKVNFLRDMHADYQELGRTYFPDVDYDYFNEKQKNTIITEIERDFAKAKPAIDNLPKHAKKAVRASYLYYTELLTLLKNTPAKIIKRRRIRVPNSKKLYLYGKVLVEKHD